MMALFAKIAGSTFLGKAKAVASSIPPQIWWAAGAILLLGLGSCVHSHKVKAHDKSIIAANDAQWQKKLDQARAEALTWKAQAEAKAAAISQDIRGRNEATLQTAAARAADQRMRGPGAARCGQGDHSQVSRPASGHEPVSWIADAAGPGLPADDRAAVPWGWLVDRAQLCDANRSEAMSWREWYQKQSAAR